MQGKPTRPASEISDALKHFDSLPDAAYVRVPVVAALFACSAMTIWRRSQAGTLPAPRKLSEAVTAWNVGELRKVLNKPALAA